MNKQTFEYPLAIFLDINETLIRTGEVALRTRLAEQRQLEEFKSLCQDISLSGHPLMLVFLTGNSFEYARRVEEPLGLKHIPGVELIIVSENGLIARSFARGELWRALPTPSYQHLVGRFLETVRNTPALSGQFYVQGNEFRLTLKPVADRFSAQQLDILSELSAKTDPDGHLQFYIHAYYIDVDPKRVVIDGTELLFTGKAFAVHRLLSHGDWYPIAVGDSPSDLPAFQAVRAHSGEAYVVSNASSEGMVAEARRLRRSYASGVNEAIRRARRSITR